jgi:hypothetical protein
METVKWSGPVIRLLGPRNEGGSGGGGSSSISSSSTVGSVRVPVHVLPSLYHVLLALLSLLFYLEDEDSSSYKILTPIYYIMCTIP